MKKIIKLLGMILGWMIPKMDAPLIHHVRLTGGSGRKHTVKFWGLGSAASEYKIYVSINGGALTLKTTYCPVLYGVYDYSDPTSYNISDHVEYYLTAKDSVSPYEVLDGIGAQGCPGVTITSGPGSYKTISWDQYRMDNSDCTPLKWKIFRGGTTGYEEELTAVAGSTLSWVDTAPDPSKPIYKVEAFSPYHSNIAENTLMSYPSLSSDSFEFNMDYNISLWKENYHSARDLSQTVEANKPKFSLFKATFQKANSHFLESGSYDLTQPITQIVMFKPNTDAINQMVIYGKNTRGCGMWLQNGNNFYFQNQYNIAAKKDSDNSNFTWAAGTKYIAIYVHDGANSQVFINGESGHVDSTPGSYNMTGVWAGKGTYGDYFDGEIYFIKLVHSHMGYHDMRILYQDLLAVYCWN